MSTNSTPPGTTLRDSDISASFQSRSSGTWAIPTAVSVVENGWGATTALAPVRALNRLDFPELGRPTRPRCSTAGQAIPGSSCGGLENRVELGEGVPGVAHQDGVEADLTSALDVAAGVVEE